MSVMPGLRVFASRVLAVLTRRRHDTDLNDEIQAHLDLLTEENVRNGMSVDDAHAAARREFGGVEQIKELYREARSFVWVDDARWDLRHAARLLRRDPLFTLTAALSLAIGIGANTTIFTVANALLFRPPAGVAEPGRLVDIGTSRNGTGFGNHSYPNYLDIRERATTLDGVYASLLFPRAMSLTGTLSAGNNAGAERVFGTVVTTNYFTVLGAVPALGRLFGAGDREQPGASPVVVLSHRFWTRRFNKDPAIVGRSLTLDGHPFTVVGIASDGFQGTGIRTGDMWVPMTALDGSTAMLTNRASVGLLVGGRLKPGVSVPQAVAEMNAIGQALEREYPDQNRGTGLRVAASSPVPGASTPVAAFLALLMGIVTLVLAIACANLAGVFLARAAARRQEIAVRLAMGAGRARLVRQLLAETLMLFALGGAAGLLLARSLTSVLVTLLPALPFPVDVSLALDGRVIVFTAGLALVAALLSGLVPALQASRADIVSALKDDAPAVGRGRRGRAFVVVQVAFSVLLVVVAGLFVRALERAGSSDPGFDPHGVELASLKLSQAGYTGVTGPRFASDLIDRVRSLPDVELATIAAVLPGGLESWRRALAVPGATPPNGQRFFNVDWNVVEPGYFATLRIPLAAGRDFTTADRDGVLLVTIVGEGTARQFWPDARTEDAVGKYVVQEEFGPNGVVPNAAKTLLVVGVARDVKGSSLIDGLSRSLVYVPLQQQYTPDITIVARTTRGQRIAEELRTLVASINPNLPIVAAQTLDDTTALGLVPQRVAASVSGSLGLFGVLLAAIGIYGLTAYSVTRRTREIGIRMALGAQRADVLVMILRQGMSLAVTGCVIGLILAAAAGRLLTAFLLGMTPIDPVTFAAAAALFVAISLAACFVPARRAARTDPMVALRYE
jgi:predicted permease